MCVCCLDFGAFGKMKNDENLQRLSKRLTIFRFYLNCYCYCLVTNFCARISVAVYCIVVIMNHVINDGLSLTAVVIKYKRLCEWKRLNGGECSWSQTVASYMIKGLCECKHKLDSLFHSLCYSFHCYLSQLL